MRYSRQHSTICNALSDAGWIVGVGAKRGVDAREMAKSDLIVVWGGNPVSTQVNVMTHIAEARKERGAKLVVVDPYRTGTAEIADLHLPPLPGTDGALACAVMHVLFKEGYADRAYLARYTDEPEGLEAHLANRAPGLGRGDHRPVGGRRSSSSRGSTARTKRSFIRIGYGFSRQRNGAAQSVRRDLPAGGDRRLAIRGRRRALSNHGLVRLDRRLIEGLDVIDHSTRMLDQSRIGPILTGDRRDLGDGPPVDGDADPEHQPDGGVARVRPRCTPGFARDDLFVCVHEQFMTETAAMADIVLPATTFLEHDDIYTAGGHTFLQLRRKVVEPYGEARSNHDVICELAQAARRATSAASR